MNTVHTDDDTHYAPAWRKPPEGVAADRQAVLADRLAAILIEAIPDVAVVLNPERQVVACNDRLLQLVGVESLDTLLGMRPGEVVGCVHACEEAGGCGTAEACRYCGALNAVLDCLASGEPRTMECRILTGDNGEVGALDLRVRATLVEFSGWPFVVLGLQDISAERRREVLERAFFHDVLNTAGGIRGTADLLTQETDVQRAAQYQNQILQLADRMIEEIRAHRDLLDAERGRFQPRFDLFSVPDLVREVVRLYRAHEVGRDRHVEIGELSAGLMNSDLTLLRRVLGNLVKNALEATEPGGTVTISAVAEADRIRFSVHNPGVIPDEARLQIFQRSFSTKGGQGRGIGLYAVKLLVHRYLGGRVTFRTDEVEGTTFVVDLPSGLDEA